MEQKKRELDIDENTISLNSLSIEVNEIFDREISIPDYYKFLALIWHNKNGTAYIR